MALVRKSTRRSLPQSPLKGVKLDPDEHRKHARGFDLTGLAVAEATNRLTPDERAELVRKLDAQQKFLRTIEVD